MEINSASTVTDSITAPKVKLSCIEYSDSSVLDKLKIISITSVECRDKHNVLLSIVDATNGFHMGRD